MTRASSIESKRILIQVIVQVFTAHSALVRPDQPALQQGSHPVNVGQQLGGRLARTGQKVVLVPIAKLLQADVPFPAVGVDRAVGLDSLLDEAVQSYCLDAPRMRFIRILPIPAPSSSAAMATSAFFCVCRPRSPSSAPPT